VEQFFVDSGGPSHHGTAGYAAIVMHDCLAGVSHEKIEADLAEFAATRLAARLKPEDREKSAPPQDLGRMLDGINLIGNDYRNMWLESAEPTVCQQACRVDKACVAWSYVKPGVQGPKARCWLKNRVPPRTADACCTSGIERF
jgi:hypothetical protein